MMLLAEVAVWSIYAFGSILFLAQAASHEIGFFIGRRRAKQTEDPGEREGVGLLVGGVLALLAFVLALTLSFANERFGERRSGTLAEANAIGTAWLRAKAIGQPRGDEIAQLLEKYAEVRRTFVTADYAVSHIDDLNQQTSALQSSIWADVSAIVHEQPNPVTNSLMVALNDVFDMTTAERFAFEFRLPSQLFWLLIGLSMLAMALLGYQQALRGPRLRIIAALLGIVWTVVIVDILDLASARLGNFRTTAAAYEWTIQSFQSGTPTPAAQKQ
ncbi:MAG TPA: hypothetical protein VL614_27030 [Acetobacteraceae bacterium]|nr:hypothetical protein [Acetobacteraceae bacterium]